jgi:hypothetical protein
VSGVRLPQGFRLERLRRDHPRARFRCGQQEVETWLARHALQQQEKHLSVTNVLLDDAEFITGYYTLATGQVDFADLPSELILDCLDDRAKAFYGQWDFAEIPGHPYRLFLSAKQLQAMMGD